MELTDLENIRTLAVALRQSDARELRLSDGGNLVHLRANPDAPPRDTDIKPLKVRANQTGTLILSDPDNSFPLPKLGTNIQAGTILAFIKGETAIYALRAPMNGYLSNIFTPHGMQVERDQQLFEFQPA